MQQFISVFGLKLPVYGLMILLGIFLANLIVILLRKKLELDMDNVILLEVYLLVGVFLGSKLLYLLVSINDIDWSRIFEPEYAKALLSGGFVFYGGLIGGLLLMLLAGKLHKIPAGEYLRKLIFLAPFGHAFGRIGCFFGGCCFGIPYHGVCSVVYPDDPDVPAPPGIPLFPVQLLESACLFAISFLVFLVGRKTNWLYTIETYFALYGVARFLLEFLRFDAYRGIYGGLSTSQWVSLALIAFAIVLFLYHKRRARAR